MKASPYSEDQIARAIQKGFVSFGDFLQKMEDDVADHKFIFHVDRLLTNIFVNHLQGKYLTKTQACRMIPAEHIETCKKYVDEAKAHGFIYFKPDPTDARRWFVVPTEEFLEFLRKRAASALDEALEIAGASRRR